jgi:hypothetical protein
MKSRATCFGGFRWSVCVFGLLAGFAVTEVAAQDIRASDAALGALIEKLTDRSTGGLVAEAQPDGSESIDLQGRFQQVVLAQLIDGDQAITSCVNSVADADVFFGRNLSTGAPLSSAAIDAHEALIAEARRHGMSTHEYQFYTDLIARRSVDLPAGASSIVIVNNDGPGEGFNSTADPFLPAPNNTGTNLGEQRLALFEAAAQVWSDFLDSSVTIQVRSQFDPLAPCSPGGGVLGSAGTLTVHRNFSNAEFANTWYHQALANKRSGSDRDGGLPDINATFNSDVDNSCLGGSSHWYYGLDNTTPSGTINLFVVLLHEMGHGLGSSSFTNGTTGAFFAERPDIWARYLFDRTAGKSWFDMTDEERAASALNTNNLMWDGANVRIASGFMTAGVDDVTGRVEMYTPNPFQGGSSVSHYNTAATPNLLMEPSINRGLLLTLDLTRQQMRDIGWHRDSTNDLVPDTITNVTPSGGVISVGSDQTITWTNNGGFNRNVTLELSLDSGVTFPFAIATDVPNTGSFDWTVPDNPTTQGRIRVREHDFLAPLGLSSADIELTGNAPPTFTPAPTIGRQQGSPSGDAVTVGTVSDAETDDGDLTVTQIAGGTAVGISVGSISNSGGTVSATLAASCTAVSGTERFQVLDGSLNGTGDLEMDVSANTPPVLSYSDQAVSLAGSLPVNPSTGLSDNGTIASVVVQSTGTYTGTISVDAAGTVSLSNAVPAGVHTITIRATDNCGSMTDASFLLDIENTAPMFTPAAALERQQGSEAGAAVTVGTVTDAESAAGDLVVTRIAGGTATGITVDSIINTNGTISATLAASCSATAGTVKFQVSDGYLADSGDLQLDVTANSDPTLGAYMATRIVEGGSIVVSPGAAPVDNGSVDSIEAVVLPATYTGTLEAELPTGDISIGDAAPPDSYVISVTVTDNCGETAQSDLALEVVGEVVFRDGFEE